MRKIFSRYLCALLIACMMVIGSFSPITNILFMNSLLVTPTTAHAASYALDTVISWLSGLGGAGIMVVLVSAMMSGPVAIKLVLSCLPYWHTVIPVGILAVSMMVIGKAIADEGLDYVLIRMAEKWKEKGKSLSMIEKEIDDIPGWLINDDRKIRAKEIIRPYMQTQQPWYKRTFSFD